MSGSALSTTTRVNGQPKSLLTRTMGVAWSWRFAILLIIIPIFGQFFHYLKDLRPLWALSKAWPVLTLPLAIALLYRPRAPFSRQLILSFLWLLLVSSAISVFTFDQNFFIGLTAQVKLLPILSFFGLLGAFSLIRPTLGEIRASFLVWGGLTLLVTLLLAALAPQEWYTGTYEIGDAPLLSNDGRGNRIRMPMFFGTVLTFYAFRRFMTTRDWRWLLLLALALFVIIGLVKTRANVLAVAGVMALVTLVLVGPRWRLAAFIAAPIAMIALFQIPYVASIFDTSESSGIDVRFITISKAVGFLGDNPLAWLFGVGTISSINPAGLADYFNHFFFLADVTWIGIVFEFGLIGAVLLLALQARCWLALHQFRQTSESPFLASLQDYILYTVIISPLYPSMTLQPGEISVVLAIVAYAKWLHPQHGLRA